MVHFHVSYAWGVEMQLLGLGHIQSSSKFRVRNCDEGE